MLQASRRGDGGGEGEAGRFARHGKLHVRRAAVARRRLGRVRRRSRAHRDDRKRRRIERRTRHRRRRRALDDDRDVLRVERRAVDVRQVLRAPPPVQGLLRVRRSAGSRVVRRALRQCSTRVAAVDADTDTPAAHATPGARVRDVRGDAPLRRRRRVGRRRRAGVRQDIHVAVPGKPALPYLHLHLTSSHPLHRTFTFTFTFTSPHLTHVYCPLYRLRMSTPRPRRVWARRSC